MLPSQLVRRHFACQAEKLERKVFNKVSRTPVSSMVLAVAIYVIVILFWLKALYNRLIADLYE